MALKLTNNATARLAASLSPTDTTVVLSPGDGAAFPTIVGGDTFPVTLVAPSNQVEICRCTARSGDVLTVVRGQENTVPKAFAIGCVVDLRLTAGALDERFAESLAVKNNLSEVTPSAARENLGIVLQSSPTDLTSGRVLAVGAFGLGTPIGLSAADNLDSVTTQGEYAWSTAVPTNSPNGHANCVMSVRFLNANTVSQEVADIGSGTLYWREKSGGAWKAWKRLATADDADPSRMKWFGTPVGSVLGPVWDHLTGVDVPPTDNPAFRYVKLSAGDSYNAGVLTSEAVSGADPKITATAVIAFAQSPLNGQTIHLINTERAFPRPGNSGVLVDSSNLSHSHTGSALSAGAHTHGYVTGASQPNSSGPNMAGSDSKQITAQTGSAGAHTHDIDIVASGGSESAPRHIGGTYYLRIL